MKKLIAFVLVLALFAIALVGCGSGNDELTAAKDYLYAMYKDAAEKTPSDYTVVGAVVRNGITYTVEWTVDVTEGVTVVVGEDKMVTIDVNEKATEAIPYVLTATLKDPDGKTVSTTFNHTVPMFKELTWAEYIATEKGETVVVKGVVTGLMAKSKGNSYNCIYFQDADGGYYAYGTATDPITDDGLEVGMTIRVTGNKDLYSGTHEIAQSTGVVEILDSGKTEVTPADFTEKYLNATSLKDETITAQQSMLVTLKGVEITGEDTANGYYKFKLGSLESYARISSSVCPLTKDDQAKFIADHASHLGWTANATGVICVYDGAFYLTPVTVDAFEYVSLPEKDDAGMVAFEKDNLTFETEFAEETVVDLRAAGQGYNQVAIAWASDSEFATVADGKLTITLPDEDTVVTLTATLTSGSVTETKEFSVKIAAPADDLCEADVVEKALALEDGKALNGKQVLRGEIVSIDTAYSADYNNITVTIKVGEATFQCYRLTGGEDLAVGDVITVTGIIKNYKGTIEFDKGCVYSKDMSVDDAKMLVVAEKAVALEEGKALNGKQVLRGEIVSIDTAYSADYGNITVTIKVGENTIQCYRLTGGEDLAVGDVITVTGIIKNYKGTIEFDKGCTYVK